MIDQRVRGAGLRPTRQRVALAEMLFAKGDRHLTAEQLHEEALVAGVPVSLATVYNTLHQFTNAGLLRILAIEGSKTYFDTNTSDHHHFFIEGENSVFDIADAPVLLTSRSSSAELPTLTPWIRISLWDTISASAKRLSKAGLKICTF